MILFFVVLLGLCIGSFLNVCIYRMPKGESIVSPGSHCPTCNKAVQWKDNIPVLSFLALKGKCRDCDDKISKRYPLVEILTAFAFYLAWTSFAGLPYQLMGIVIFSSLIVMTFIDLDHQIIPDEISLGGIVLGLVFSFFFPAWHAVEAGWPALKMSFIGVLVGGGFLLVLSLVAEAIMKKEAMGGGDIKYLAAVGAFLGWQGAFLTLFFASTVGSIVFLIIRFWVKEERLPFGPYLAIGTLVTLLWGQTILSGYFDYVLQ